MLLLACSLIVAAVIFVVSIRKKRISLINKHVVITGGSSGIGKELAKLLIKNGAHVTIVARNEERLIKVYNELKKASLFNEQIITTISVDVSDYDDLKIKLTEVEEAVGPIFMLANCAGFAVCRKLEDYTVQTMKNLVDINLLGTLYATKVVLPKFKERKEGIIIITASQVGMMGMFGYSVYASCKFALRGLAESIYMEVKPYNISVTLALPPDTDTPGYTRENESKPQETKLISSGGKLYRPKDVALKILDDALKGKFFSVIGWDCFLLSMLCSGMSPSHNLLEVLMQVLLLGPLRAIGLIYLWTFNDKIKRCHVHKDYNKLN